MSNFQELQAEKKDWTLASDEKLFEKLKYLEDNVVASTHLVHNSINELQRAYSASSTTLNNTINAFNLMRFNKFVENVVEETEDSMAFPQANQSQAPFSQNPNETQLDQTAFIGDLRGEDEKLAEALMIALNEITQAKEDRREAKAQQDDEGMGDGQIVLPGSSVPIQIDTSMIKQKTKILQKNYLGTSKVIKLPYIIGSDEYNRHPYAGVIYKGQDEFEQLDLYQEEMDQLLKDKKFEDAQLQKNAEDMAKVEQFQEHQEQIIIAQASIGVPPPPPPILGFIPPPPPPPSGNLPPPLPPNAQNPIQGQRPPPPPPGPPLLNQPPPPPPGGPIGLPQSIPAPPGGPVGLPPLPPPGGPSLQNQLPPLPPGIPQGTNPPVQVQIPTAPNRANQMQPSLLTQLLPQNPQQNETKNDEQYGQSSIFQTKNDWRSRKTARGSVIDGIEDSGISGAFQQPFPDQAPVSTIKKQKTIIDGGLFGSNALKEDGESKNEATKLPKGLFDDGEEEKEPIQDPKSKIASKITKNDSDDDYDFKPKVEERKKTLAFLDDKDSDDEQEFKPALTRNQNQMAAQNQKFPPKKGGLFGKKDSDDSDQDLKPKQKQLPQIQSKLPPTKPLPDIKGKKNQDNEFKPQPKATIKKTVVFLDENDDEDEGFLQVTMKNEIKPPPQIKPKVKEEIKGNQKKKSAVGNLFGDDSDESEQIKMPQPNSQKNVQQKKQNLPEISKDQRKRTLILDEDSEEEDKIKKQKPAELPKVNQQLSTQSKQLPQLPSNPKNNKNDSNKTNIPLPNQKPQIQEQKQNTIIPPLQQIKQVQPAEQQIINKPIEQIIPPSQPVVQQNKQPESFGRDQGSVVKDEPRLSVLELQQKLNLADIIGKGRPQKPKQSIQPQIQIQNAPVQASQNEEEDELAQYLQKKKEEEQRQSAMINQNLSEEDELSKYLRQKKEEELKISMQQSQIQAQPVNTEEDELASYLAKSKMSQQPPPVVQKPQNVQIPQQNVSAPSQITNSNYVSVDQTLSKPTIAGRNKKRATRVTMAFDDDDEDTNRQTTKVNISQSYQPKVQQPQQQQIAVQPVQQPVKKDELIVPDFLKDQFPDSRAPSTNNQNYYNDTQYNNQSYQNNYDYDYNNQYGNSYQYNQEPVPTAHNPSEDDLEKYLAAKKLEELAASQKSQAAQKPPPIQNQVPPNNIAQQTVSKTPIEQAKQNKASIKKKKKYNQSSDENSESDDSEESQIKQKPQALIQPVKKSVAIIENNEKTLKKGAFEDSDEDEDFKPIAQAKPKSTAGRRLAFMDESD